MTGSGLSDQTIAPIENVPLRVQVADMLRTAIINGKLRPGAQLVETALADQLNVSRAPVREAIHILEGDGLIETAAYKGTRVKPLTAREIEEISSLREAYETLAIRRMVERRAPVEALWDSCRAMAVAAEAEDFESLISADEAFHRTMIRLADHALLLASWNSLYLRIHQIMALRNRANTQLAEIAAKHPPIVEALGSGDVDLAVRLIGEHARSAADLDGLDLSDTDEGEP